MTGALDVSREEIWQALFDLVADETLYKTTSRRLRGWDQVSLFPAQFLREGEEQIIDQVRGESKLILYGDVIIYSRTDDDSRAPGQDLNPLLDALVEALRPSHLSDGQQTLNGLVTHARINGRIMKDLGHQDGISVAVVPIEILVTQ